MPEQAREESRHLPEEHTEKGKRAQRPGAPGSRAGYLVGLQRAAGNRAVARLVQGGRPVLGSESGIEHAADILAPAIDSVLSGHSPAPTGAVAGPGTASSGDGGFPVSDEFSREVDSAHGGGAGLAPEVQERVGSAFGADLGSVRVHTDDRADQLANDIDAKAFTSGQDIFLRRSQSDYSHAEARQTLSHELAHVVRGDAGGGVARLSDDQRNGLFQRATALDYQTLVETAERAPLVAKLNGLKGSGDKENRDVEDIEREMLKQLVLTSGRSTDDIAPLVDSAVDRNDPTQLREKLQRGKIRPSGPIFKLVTDCRYLINDYYRAEQQKGGGADAGDLVKEAKKYDEGGGGALAGQLTHQRTYRKFGLFKKTKTESHTLESVIEKARAASTVDLRHFNSPESMPRGGATPEGTPIRRGRVGVVGGGPVGLMAALEARMRGVDVILFEARTDEYSRRQVLVLDQSTVQKFAKFGIRQELLYGPSAKGTSTSVAVKYIEKILRDRCAELGVEIRAGWFLAQAKEGDDGRTTRAVFQVGQDKRKARLQEEELDLLVVAAGAGVAKSNKYTGAVLGDELGFKFDVKEARDYAVVGLFESTEEGRVSRGEGATTAEKKRWAYRFNTPKVTYVLQQIPPELYREFSGEGGRQKMETFLKKVAKEHFEMTGAMLAPSVNKKGQQTPNIGMFPIEIQQAQTFVNSSLRTLLIGDSAATPHPHTGSGLNTGVRELDALSDVIDSIRTDIEMRAHGGKGDKGKEVSEGEDESPDTVKAALERYNTEMKTLTDNMVSKAMNTLAREHASYLKEAIADLRARFGGLLESDYSSGSRLESISNALTKITAQDSTWSKDNQLSFLLDAQAEVARIRENMESLSKRD
jgi:2-polyprenyl-6-methoxyphenol hydroxylase-like FAD-dependent oxidoreductase